MNIGNGYINNFSFNAADFINQETLHHLHVAYRKGYINKQTYLTFQQRYGECAKMLRGLESALRRWKAREGDRLKGVGDRLKVIGEG